MTVTLRLSHLVAACIIWSVITAIVEHYGFGRGGAEVFTRVYWLLGGAFGAFCVGITNSRRS